MSTSKAYLVSVLLAVAEARFGQEQIPVAAIQALGNFGNPGVAATLAGSVPSSLLAASSPCDKLKIADQLISDLGDDQAVIDAAKGLVAAETNFNPFAVSVPFVCADASLPATAALRGIVPLVDPAVGDSDVENANSATSLNSPFDATGLSQAEVMIAQGFTNFTAVAADGSKPVLAGQDGAGAGAGAGNNAGNNGGNNGGNNAGNNGGNADNNAGDDAAGDDAADDDNAADGGAAGGAQCGGNAGNQNNGNQNNNGGNQNDNQNNNGGNNNNDQGNNGGNQNDNQNNNGGNNNNDNQNNNGGNQNDNQNNNGGNQNDNQNNNGGNNNDNQGNNGGNAGNGGNGAADFGQCTPTIARVGGLNGRPATEFTFIPQDPLVAQGQQEALNPNIITNRICDQLTNVCEANDAAKALCKDAQAQIQALGTRDQSTADTWNALLGFAGADSSVATL